MKHEWKNRVQDRFDSRMQKAKQKRKEAAKQMLIESQDAEIIVGVSESQKL